MRAIKLLLLGLTILMSVCTTVVFFSCKPLPPKEAAGPRNLIPGLSEALTEFTVRYPDTRGFLLLERSDSDEEAKNLAGLIEKAFEAGGWEVKRLKRSASPVRGLLCHYGSGAREKADDLISVFKNKGLRIEGVPIEDPSPDNHEPFLIFLEIGLKP